MYIVCQNAKYGCCKRGKKCDQIHLTDICEKKLLCREKFCDKWHPIGCFYYKKYGKCKFGEYCSYKHASKVKENLWKQVKKLGEKVIDLTNTVKIMKSKLEKICLSDNTVVEILSDDDMQEEVANKVLLNENTESDPKTLK